MSEVVLKWAMRYHSLEVDEFDSLDAALRSALLMADQGEEALRSIEVVSEGGTSRVYTADECWALGKPIEDEQWAAYKSRPDPVAVLEIQTLDGEWVVWSTFSDRAKADAQAVEWSALGDRVRVKAYQKTSWF